MSQLIISLYLCGFVSVQLQVGVTAGPTNSTAEMHIASETPLSYEPVHGDPTDLVNVTNYGQTNDTSVSSSGANGGAWGPLTLCGAVPSPGRSETQGTEVIRSTVSWMYHITDVTQEASTRASSNTPPVSHELVSPEVYLKAKAPLEDLKTIFSALALIINLINVVVLAQKSMRNPSSAYLVTLCVTQFTHVSLEFVPKIYDAISPLAPTSQFYLTYGLYVFNYVMVVLGRFTYCLTTMVCSERFFALAFPLKASRSRLIASPVAVILMSAVLMFLCHVDIALKYEVYPAVVLGTGETLYAFRFTRAYFNNMRALDSWALVTKAVFVYVMLFLALLVNVMLVVALHRHRRSRHQMTTSDDADKRRRQEREITVTILVSSTVFTALGLPLASNSMAVQVAAPGNYGFFSVRCHTFLFLQLTGNTLFALSFCTDFCIFLLFSSAYRTTLRHVIARAAGCGKWGRGQTRSEAGHKFRGQETRPGHVNTVRASV